MTLEEEVKAAAAMGLSYGKYRALMDTAENTANKKDPIPARKKRKKRYADDKIFKLWQQGKTDAEIAAILGSSRSMIQKWRDNMEIPSVSTKGICREKYRLVETEYGLYVLQPGDEL